MCLIIPRQRAHCGSSCTSSQQCDDCSWWPGHKGTELIKHSLCLTSCWWHEMTPEYFPLLMSPSLRGEIWNGSSVDRPWSEKVSTFQKWPKEGTLRNMDGRVCVWVCPLLGTRMHCEKASKFPRSWSSQPSVEHTVQTSLICGGPTLWPTGIKGSAAHILVPDTTAKITAVLAAQTQLLCMGLTRFVWWQVYFSH